jgi:hypothetical protein
MYSYAMRTTAHCCRMCGATSYRRVIDRDEHGALRPTALYQCSGCSVVFADPKAWREGEPDVSSPTPPVERARPLITSSTGIPYSSDYRHEMRLPAASAANVRPHNRVSDE